MTDKDDEKVKIFIDKTAEVTKGVTEIIQSTQINSLGTAAGDYCQGKKWTYRFKKGDKISLKLYKSGWKRGGKAHIKTNEIAKLGKQLSKNFSIFDRIISGAAAIADFVQGKYKDFTKDIISFAGGTGGAMLGAKIGGIIGSFFPGMGTLGGSVGGGLLGGYLCGKGCEIVGEKIYDHFSDKFGNNSSKCSGIKGAGDTGGIEFITPKIMTDFKRNFCFNSELFISFKKYSFNTEKEILSLLNNKILINGVKFSNINEVFSTILHELSIGYLSDKKLPFISLNFNKESLLYSIMDEFFKHTLVGHVLTLLDYYLKCFVNGGFFEEEFIFEWYKSKNTNKEYLEKNFINMKKHLLSVFGDKNKIFYESMNDLKTTKEGEKQKFLSAFRIIGKIKNQILYCNDLIMPDCDFDVEYDIDIFPEFKQSVANNDENKKIIYENEQSHKLMSILIKAIMDKIPKFQPYFELLNIITFCLHYLPNIQACGMFPDLSNSLIKTGKKYIKNIPPIYPPLPIKKTITLNVSVTIKELLGIFSKSKMQTLNQILSIRFLELNNDLMTMKILNESIEKEIISFMYKKLKELLGNNDYLVDITNDNKLGIHDVLSFFSENMNCLICFQILGNYSELNQVINQLIKEFKLNISSYKLDNTKIMRCTSFKQLYEESENLLKKYNLVLAKTKQSINYMHNEQVEKFKNEWNKKKQENYDNLKRDIRNNVEEMCRKNNCYDKLEEIMQKKEVKDLISNGETKINNHFNDIYSKQMNEFNENLNKRIQMVSNNIGMFEKNLKNALNKLNSELKNNTAININKFEDKVLKGLKVDYTLNLQSLVFDLSSDSESKIETRGGCLSRINKNLVLIENNIENDIYKNIVNQNNEEYICVKSNLINSPVFGQNLKNLVKNNYNLNQNDLINSVINKNNNNLKDFSGFAQEHYKALLGDRELINSSNLNIKSDSGITPELIAVTISNYKLVSDLLQLNNSDFSSPTYNGITPLLSALLNQDEYMANLLLDYPNKIGDINYTNELNMTPLHYACLYNMPEISKKIIMKNAKIDLGEKKNGNTPLHLLCENSNIETLEYILENNINISQYINIQRPDKKTPFYFASSNSILCTKLLLRKNIDISILDSYGINCSDIAIYSGRFDCYQQIYMKQKINQKLLKQILNHFKSKNSYENNKNNIKNLINLFKKGYIEKN